MKVLKNTILIKISVYFLKNYQLFISPLFPDTCKFYPTCSQYAIESIQKFGILKGFIQSVWRIIRCNPLNPGGFDPV